MPKTAAQIIAASVPPTEAMLTEKEFAKLAKLPAKNFREWRCRKIGPSYVKLGRAVRYPRAEVIAWLTANMTVIAAS